jgi:hypothetical protein
MHGPLAVTSGKGRTTLRESLRQRSPGLGSPAPGDPVRGRKRHRRNDLFGQGER